MLETDVIGHSHWTKGFLSESDVKYLEALDCERSANPSINHSSSAATDYQQLAEEYGAHEATHCEHGIPLYRKCPMCQGLVG